MDQEILHNLEDLKERVKYICIIFVLEKSKIIREAEVEYKDLLRQLEEDENVTAEDIESFKKNALIHKSV